MDNGREVFKRADYEGDLNRLKEAQRNAAVANLENTRNQALSNLQAERAQNTATYNQQRSSANAQNRLSARNFQEYLAQTGRANSGLSAQARMQNANNLNTSINALNTGEAAAIADINRRNTDAQNAYNTGLASANAQIEANYIQNLLNERQKQFEREMQEKQYQENVRQFNENMALQRQQLQSRFSSGSGGGSSSRSSSSRSSGKSSSNNSGQYVTNSKTVSKLNDAQSKSYTKGKENWDIGEVKTSQGGKANVKLFTVNGQKFYNTTNGWKKY